MTIKNHSNMLTKSQLTTLYTAQDYFNRGITAYGIELINHLVYDLEHKNEV